MFGRDTTRFNSVALDQIGGVITYERSFTHVTRLRRVDQFADDEFGIDTISARGWSLRYGIKSFGQLQFIEIAQFGRMDI